MDAAVGTDIVNAMKAKVDEEGLDKFWVRFGKLGEFVSMDVYNKISNLFANQFGARRVTGLQHIPVPHASDSPEAKFCADRDKELSIFLRFHEDRITIETQLQAWLAAD